MATKGKFSEAWARRAELDLDLILRKMRHFNTLRKLAPRPTRWTVHLKIVGSYSAMAKINSDYRGKNKATDVLSFPAPQFFKREGILGDLAICLPVMKRQAQEMGHSLQSELQVLLVHGVLHLLGLDHEADPVEAKRMRKWESKVLRAIEFQGKGLIDRSS